MSYYQKKMVLRLSTLPKKLVSIFSLIEFRMSALKALAHLGTSGTGGTSFSTLDVSCRYVSLCNPHIVVIT